MNRGARGKRTANALMILAAIAGSLVAASSCGSRSTAPIAAGPPRITSFDPESLRAGANRLDLDVRGEGFVAGAVVEWDEVAVSTTFQSPLWLQARVEAAAIATPRAVEFRVRTPDGQLSSPALFQLTPRAPNLAELEPSSAVAGSAGFELVATGGDFENGAVVEWDERVLPTTVLSRSRLSATVTAEHLAEPGVRQVRVRNFTGGSSSLLSFTVLPAPRSRLPAVSSRPAPAPRPRHLLAL